MRTARFAILLALTACAGTPEQPSDDFVRAAESWEGYPVAKMIEVWGEPDVHDEDRVTWQLRKNTVRCRDVLRRRRVGNEVVEYTVRECAETQSYQYNCRVTATFDALGEIVEITARSYRCGREFADYIRLLDSQYPNNLYKYGDPGDHDVNTGPDSSR